ncbi:MAG: glycosyl hydrolase [Cytophagia bacterium]|nr:glycosyl hydrolase [Cytophagia bacterium]
MKLIAGTDKGLIIYQKTNNDWKLTDIQFIGMPISAFHQDDYGNWWVAINHKHWGPKLYRSKNEGETFEEVEAPKFDQTSPYSLQSIWTINSFQNKLYIGTEPAALFVSSDKGFVELKGLSHHPSRDQWQGGGKGSRNPFLHSLVFNPTNSAELMVGISCAGVMRSFDSGESWNPSNNGLKAFFLPDSEAEVGHDPHSIIRHPKDPNVLWQQNHCGIFRSADDGEAWVDVSDTNHIAVYGFDLVVDENDVDVAWVIPAQSDDLRYPHNTKLEVYQTIDGGKNWKSKSKGLPQGTSFDLVLRSAFDKSENLMAFGTNNGNLYLSEDNSENWQPVNQNLSAVRTVNLIK